MASVFDQAEKLEQTPGATSASAGNVFDQAEQLDAPKTSKVFPIPKVGLTGTENIGPALPYASSNPSPSLSDAAVSAASSVGSFAGDVLGGFGKGAAKTFYGLARAASDPEQFSDEAGKQRARAFQAQHLTPPSDIEPSNVGEKIGNVGENVAEFLLPAGEAAKGAEATKAAFGGTKLARMAALGVRSAGEGAFGALQEYAKSGGDADKAKSAGLSQAATSAVLGGVGAGLSKLGRSGYANLFKLSPGDFAYGRDPLEAVRVSGVGIVNSLSELKQKLAAELAEHGRVIGDMLDLSPNASTFDRAEIGRQIRTAAAEHSNGLEFFGGDASSLQRMADNVATSAENASTLRELHELKTSVGKQVGWAGESQIENARQAALREIYGRLNEFISANSPGLR